MIARNLGKSPDYRASQRRGPAMFPLAEPKTAEHVARFQRCMEAGRRDSSRVHVVPCASSPNTASGEGLTGLRQTGSRVLLVNSAGISPSPEDQDQRQEIQHWTAAEIAPSVRAQ